MQIFQILKNIFKTVAFVLFAIITQGWQAFGIVVIAILNDRPWECLFIFIGFIVGRYFFGKTYHAQTLTICTIITWIVFYFLTSSVPTFEISITLPCIFGISLAYILSIISEYVDGRSDYIDS